MLMQWILNKISYYIWFELSVIQLNQLLLNEFCRFPDSWFQIQFKNNLISIVNHKSTSKDTDWWFYI